MTTPTNTNAPKEFTSLKAAAQRLDISLRSIYRLIARGVLPRPVKVGGASKLFESDIRNYVASLQAQRR